MSDTTPPRNTLPCTTRVDQERRDSSSQSAIPVSRYLGGSMDSAERVTKGSAGVGKPRIALYSHDTMGLGHMRRNLLIAQALMASQIDPIVLLVAGARQAGVYWLPQGVDCLSLPSLQQLRYGDMDYTSRYLDMPLTEIIKLRADTVRAALKSFAPDLLIVDNIPRGAVHELDATLKALRGKARCVLGLRDVPDEPEKVRREWGKTLNAKTLRDFYQEVWIYGDPKVYDSIHEYGFDDSIIGKTRYVGYLDQRERLNHCPSDCKSVFENLGFPRGKLVLCMVGSGDDGTRLAAAFAHIDLPAGYNGILLTGPYMRQDVQQQLHTHTANNPRLRVLDYLIEPGVLIQRADRIITMGGYNSVCDVLTSGKPALIVPRVLPHREQWMRAHQLSRLGLADVLHPEEVTSRALGKWLSRNRTRARTHVNMNGLNVIRERVADLINNRIERT
ncbi:MAG: glycosyltransferase family protein [Burkholderiales bacterium]